MYLAVITLNFGAPRTRHAAARSPVVLPRPIHLPSFAQKFLINFVLFITVNALAAPTARVVLAASPVTISACIDGACPALRLEVDGRVAAAADWVRGRLWRRILVHARW